MTKIERKEYQRKWRESHKGYYKLYCEKNKYQISANRKRWWATHKKKHIEYENTRKKKYIYKPESEKVSKHKNYYLWVHAKRRAKKSKVPFTIKVTDIIMMEHCPYLNIPLYRGNKIHCANSPSIDRIVPEKGYIPENIQVISYKANLMKNDASIDRLIIFANNILRIHSS